MGLLVRVVRTEVRVGLFGVFFLVLARFGVLVAEDKMELVVLAALIRSEHDGVRGLINELVLNEGERMGELLQPRFQKCWDARYVTRI